MTACPTLRDETNRILNRGQPKSGTGCQRRRTRKEGPAIGFSKPKKGNKIRKFPRKGQKEGRTLSNIKKREMRRGKPAESELPESMSGVWKWSQN